MVRLQDSNKRAYILFLHTIIEYNFPMAPNVAPCYSRAAKVSR